MRESCTQLVTKNKLGRNYNREHTIRILENQDNTREKYLLLFFLNFFHDSNGFSFLILYIYYPRITWRDFTKYSFLCNTRGIV